MSAVFGLLLVTLAVLLFGGVLAASRRRTAPGWLRESAAASAIVITTIGLFVIGLGLTVQFAVSYGREPLGWIESSLIGAMLVVMAIAFAAIGRLVRGQDSAARRDESAVTGHGPQDSADLGVTPFPPTSTPPDLTPQSPRTGSRSPGKRAA